DGNGDTQTVTPDGGAYGNYTIPAGVQNVVVSVPTATDDLQETSESFGLTVSTNQENVSIGTSEESLEAGNQSITVDGTIEDVAIPLVELVTDEDIPLVIEDVENAESVSVLSGNVNGTFTVNELGELI